MKGGPTVNPQPGTVVLDDDLVPLAPGTGAIGRVARSGRHPGRLLQGSRSRRPRPSSSAPTASATPIPGDCATIEADGTIALLGRGSVSINSGGEKIYPEEVEAAVKSHPAVWDAVVVGVPDERWGQRVAAVLELRPGATVTLDDLQDHCRTKIAGLQGPPPVAPGRHRRALAERQARLPLGQGRRRLDARCPSCPRS